MDGTSSVRFSLRAATAQEHARLDCAIGSVALHESFRYGRFLQALATALVPVEQELEEEGIAAVLPDWNERSRRRFILDDLSELGLPMRVVRCQPIRGEAALFGAAYVLEGSRLGAQVLLRRVASSLPQRFLQSGNKRHLWRSFLLRLEMSEQVQLDPNAAIAAARDVFKMFEHAVYEMHAPMAESCV